jgi:hypothetical protein
MAGQEIVANRVALLIAQVQTASTSSTERPSDLTEWTTTALIAFIEQYQLTALILTVLGAVGFVYGGYQVLKSVFGLRKDAADIRKGLAETRKLDLENMKQLHEVEERHAEENEKLNILLAGLVTALQEQRDAGEVDRLREELINHYCQTYLPTLGKYLDFYEVHYDKRTCRDFIQSLVLKELGTSEQFSDVVNFQPILDQLKGRSSLRLTRSSFSKIWRFCHRNVGWWQFRLKARLAEEKKKWPD